MAHFAKLNEDNHVLEVIVVNNNVLDPENEENSGIAFLTELFGYSNWKQTSYNGNFRKQYASVGKKWDPEHDAFIDLQPYPSWTFNNQTLDWDPPVIKPVDGNLYIWNEENLTWDQVEL